MNRDHQDPVQLSVESRAVTVGQFPKSLSRSVATNTIGSTVDVECIPVSCLSLGDSPRLDGIDEAHVCVLAESADPLPPILVHRETMRIIDGAHRYHAALLRGDKEIRVTYFLGDSGETFARAVQENVRHGLPLTRVDRENAALRIIDSLPAWSDRRIASVAGLSPTTVGKLRKQVAPGDGQPATRRGRDGRLRPIDSEARRLATHKIMQDRPNASLREVARQTGVSVATALDVRRKMTPEDARSAAELPPSDTGESLGAEGTKSRRVAKRAARGRRDRVGAGTAVDLRNAWQNLHRDASMRSRPESKNLLHWMGVHLLDDETQEATVHAIPPHCARAVAALARRCSDRWSRLADAIETTR